MTIFLALSLARIQLEQLLCFAVFILQIIFTATNFYTPAAPAYKVYSFLYCAVCTRCCECVSEIHFFSFAQSRLRMRARGPGENGYVCTILAALSLCCSSTPCNMLCGKKGCGTPDAAPLQIKTNVCFAASNHTGGDAAVKKMNENMHRIERNVMRAPIYPHIFYKQTEVPRKL